MNVVKKILAIVIFAFLLLAIGSLIIGNKINVSEEITIDAPANRINSLVNDYREWGKWSPWADTAEAKKMTITFDGEAYGKGAIMRWESKNEKGEVDMAGYNTTTEATREKVQYITTITAPWDAEGTGTFTFKEENGKTVVTWAYDSKVDMPVLGAYIAMFSVQPEIETVFRKGLENIKKVAEAQ